MKATTDMNSTTHEVPKDEQAAQVGMGIIVAFSALCGVWGATCFLAAMAQNGIAQMVAGFGKAIIGG